ncbi:MAG: YceD family protein [Acidimicrobiia bacterium]
MSYLVQISDLLVDPGAAREETGSIPLVVDLPNAAVDGEGAIEVKLRSLSDGVVARGTVHVNAELTCKRCLTSWSEPVEISFEQVYRREPDDADDELGLIDGHSIDLEPAVHDEVVLSLPTAPVCRDDCLGLCAVCGTDLNVDPCDGHGDGSDSPFAALKQLFDS